MTPSPTITHATFLSFAHALKIVKPHPLHFDGTHRLDAYQSANRQWIEAVKLQADLLAQFGYTRNAFLDACDF